MTSSSTGHDKPNCVVITPAHKSLLQLLVCQGCTTTERDTKMNEFYSNSIDEVGQLIYEKFDKLKHDFTFTLPFFEVKKSNLPGCLNNYFIDFENKRRDVTLRVSTFYNLKENMESFAGNWRVTSNGPYFKQQVSIMVDDYNAVLGGAAMYRLSLDNVKVNNQPYSFIVNGNSKYLNYGSYLKGRIWLLGKEDALDDCARCFIQDITFDFVKGSMKQETGRTVIIEPELTKNFSFNMNCQQFQTQHDDWQLEY